MAKMSVQELEDLIFKIDLMLSDTSAIVDTKKGK